MPIQRAKPKFTDVKNVSVTTAQLPAGAILQHLQTGAISEVVHNSNQGTWLDSNYTLAITPSATSSRILIHVHFPFALKNSGTKLRGSMRLNRAISGGATTLIWNTDSYLEQMHGRDAGGTPDEINQIANMTFIDSPNTTSATTYTMQILIKNDSGATQVISHRSSYGGAVILQEIKG
tara:strand:- start:1699 stop:2232 length:534 start_codon:yes stop_codon:yes gene_type:complete